MADNGDSEKADEPVRSGAGQRSEGNEWTLSDTRGPLGAAGSEGGEVAREELTPAVPPEASTAPTPPNEISGTEISGTETSGSTRASAAEPPMTTSPATEQPRHVPVLPIIAALVVGAVIGAGSAGIVYKSMDQGTGQWASQGDVNALSSRVDALAKRPDPQPEIDQLKASLDKAAAAPKAQAFDPAPLQQKIDALASDVDGLKKQDANQGLADKVTALEGTVAGLKTQGSDVKGLDDKVAGLATTTDGLEKKVTGLEQRDQATQGSVATLQNDQKTLAAKAGAPALAVVADSLVEAITLGKPYASQVDAAASLGADSAKVAVLRENADKGVPSALALATRFAPLADPITATASHAPANAGLVDRLKSGMLSMVSIRRADGTTGDDPGSRASRIEADLTHDDVAGAYATWEGLPAAAKARSDAWGALAKTHVEAMAAARALQQQALAALGGKKS